MTQVFNIEEAMRNQGLTPGTVGNRHEPNISEITNTVSENSDRIINQIGEMISTNDPEFIALKERNPDLTKIMQVLSDKKKSH